MNGVTKEIAQKLGVDLQYALRVQKLMECSGLNFSECEQHEFDASMNEARRAVDKSDSEVRA